MSDYYGAATLEDWLGEEIFFMKVVPHFIVTRFEKYREAVERDIEAWMMSDDGEGNPLSWRGWGRGFNSIDDSDEVLSELIEKAKEDIVKVRRVVCAANRLPGGELILGARHWDGLMRQQFTTYLRAHNKKEEDVVGKVVQGFVDQWGNFLNREAAWYIAYHQGQVVHTGPGFNGPELYSENIY